MVTLSNILAERNVSGSAQQIVEHSHSDTTPKSGLRGGMDNRELTGSQVTRVPFE